MKNTINFTRPKLDRLRAAHKRAKEAGLEQFEFEGTTLLVSYAGYLIEFLETKLPKD